MKHNEMVALLAATIFADRIRDIPARSIEAFPPNHIDFAGTCIVEAESAIEFIREAWPDAASSKMPAAIKKQK